MGELYCFNAKYAVYSYSKDFWNYILCIFSYETLYVIREKKCALKLLSQPLEVGY